MSLTDELEEKEFSFGRESRVKEIGVIPVNHPFPAKYADNQQLFTDQAYRREGRVPYQEIRTLRKARVCKHLAAPRMFADGALVNTYEMTS